MKSQADGSQCDHAARVSLYALGALSAVETQLTRIHIATCPLCSQQMQRLRPLVDTLVYWPTDVLRPSSSLWPRLSALTASSSETETSAGDETPHRLSWREPEWKEAAPGISCKTLSIDHARNELTLLVRLGAGVAYPPHRHGGVEELHLLDGELWIEDRLLHPGDYNRAEPGTCDQRVWTETGCTCLLITSSQDILL